MNDPWYPLADDYYVDNPDPTLDPVRQGDVFVVPDVPIATAASWSACILMHPTCEYIKSSVKELQVAPLYSLLTLDETNQVRVTEGREDKDGQVQVAMAHTAFYPPVGTLTEPMYANFRESIPVPKENLDISRRIGAIRHETRVYFIRRRLLWQQRWNVPLAQVFQWEADRIKGDPHFAGQKPDWVFTAGSNSLSSNPE